MHGSQGFGLCSSTDVFRFKENVTCVHMLLRYFMVSLFFIKCSGNKHVCSYNANRRNRKECFTGKMLKAWGMCVHQCNLS